MKTLGVLAATLALGGIAWAFQSKAINDTCPVKGEPVKNITTTYKGKTIGFC
jgi:hypothetical protein